MPSSAQPPVLTIAVGIICRDGRFLVARRLAGTHAAGTWEFPGGKLRRSETLEGALRREIEEETGLKFRDAVLLHLEEHVYPERTVELHFFLCRGPEGEAEGRQGQEVRWVKMEELEQLSVPEGNRGFLRLLRDQLSGEGAEERA